MHAVRASRYRSCLGIALVAALSGCATAGADENMVFRAGGAEALVVFGLPDARYGDAIHFLAIDPATCRAARPYRSQTFRVGDMLGRIDDNEFRLAVWEPGVWVLHRTERGTAAPMTITYEDNSVAFEVRAGRFSYIGDFGSALAGNPHRGHSEATMAGFLAPYSGIEVSPEAVSPQRTRYSREPDGERVAGCTL